LRSSNHRASLAVVLGLLGVLVIPAGILVARQYATIGLLDAAWAIPVAMLCAVGALLFVRGARGRIRLTLERAGGSGRIRLGRILAVAGICVALSASIAVGFYELLLRLEG
jgi:peptidoglycan/LPS O-acetylase OafA/YrhL